jgi:hypothetical protein
VDALQAMSDDYSNGIEGEKDGEQYNDASGRQFMESRLLAHSPVVDL